MKHMVKNIAFIGDSESVKGFSAVGIDVLVCDDTSEAAMILKNTADKDMYAVIFMTEELFETAEKEVNKLSEQSMPAVIPLPGARGNNGIGIKRLSSFVEQAVGSDILFKNLIPVDVFQTHRLDDRRGAQRQRPRRALQSDYDMYGVCWPWIM